MRKKTVLARMKAADQGGQATPSPPVLAPAHGSGRRAMQHGVWKFLHGALATPRRRTWNRVHSVLPTLIRGYYP